MSSAASSRRAAARANRLRSPFGHLPELRHRGGVIGLREDRSDDRCDRLPGSLRDGRQQVTHEMHAAALPGGAREHCADRLLQALMRIGDDQAHAMETALHEAAQKRRLERAVLRRPHVGTQHLTLALAGDADADDGRLAEDAPVHAHLVVRRVIRKCSASMNSAAMPHGRKLQRLRQHQLCATALPARNRSRVARRISAASAVFLDRTAQSCRRV